MFRDRIIHWSRILDLWTCTISTEVVLAKARTGTLLFARTYQSKVQTPKLIMDHRRDLANAYVQISRLNR